MRTSSSTIAYCYGLAWANLNPSIYIDTISVLSVYDIYTSFRIVRLLKNDKAI